MKRPQKIANVLQKARECLELGRYYDTSHAKLRQSQRNIALPHITYIIKHGYHERKKDEFRPEHSRWTYAIRGLTIDERDLRIIIAFDENNMLIITVIDLLRGSG